MRTHIFYDIIAHMKRSIWFWTCFIIAIIFGIYFSTRIIMTLTGHGNLAYIHHISIYTDIKKQDLSGIANAVSLPHNTKAKSINLEQIRQKVSAVPGVKDVAIRHLPNGNIIIRTSMHHAVALWTDDTNFFPLSADGTIVNTPTAVRNITDVVFRGPVPNDISEITRAAQGIVGHINYMEWIENRRWNIHTTTGTVIMLPEVNPTSAIGSLINLNTNYKILSKELKTIDLRDDTRILVKQ